MKKVSGLFLALSAVIITASAQKLKESEVPAVVVKAFEKQHPGIKGEKWEKEKGDFEVGFTNSNVKTTEVYDAKGIFKESEVEIKPTELPATATNYIAIMYKGAKIKEATKITKALGEVNYEAEVNGSDVIFDAKGKFIKAEKKLD